MLDLENDPELKEYLAGIQAVLWAEWLEAANKYDQMMADQWKAMGHACADSPS